jgi:Fe/S biogenesis protein NfuA
MNANITESAQGYLKDLLDKQDAPEGIGIRIFISNPGTQKAETCLIYCRTGEEVEGDHIVEYAGFKVYFEERSLVFLEDAIVDYAADNMGGQLTIRAPNSKMPQVNDDSPLEDKVNYILYNEINPSLASHGGAVELTEITEDGFLILKFGGGCQGCSAVDVTLKQGVEATLMEQLSDVKGVRDVTDHTDTSNAYYN